MQLAPVAGIDAGRTTSDLIERKLYSRDLAPVPAIITRPFFKTLPDAVVIPSCAREVAALVRWAHRERTPVTPRAAASTSFYNSVPVRGGVLLDVNSMRGITELNAAQRTVRVLPATTWWELDDELRQRGFAAKSYPSSAVSATVGGWISTQGHGIGSLRYGPLAEQLVSLEVVLPNGEQRVVDRGSDPPLDWFVAAEGTLGVITGVELSVRPVPAVEAHHLFAFDDLPAMGLSLQILARAEPRPFTVLFADAGYLRLLARAGFQTPAARLPGGAGVDVIVLVSLQGEALDVSQGERMLSRLPGRELPSGEALEEWNLRLYHLRTKRVGPSLLASEQWLPLDRLPGYLAAVQKLARRHRQTVGNYGLVVTPSLAMVMTIYPADERRPVEYMAAIGFTKRLYDLGAACGGRPYGVGMWNTPYLGRLFSKERLAELRQRKMRLDPNGIMNPGKLYDAPFPLWPVVFKPGAALLSTGYYLMWWRR